MMRIITGKARGVRLSTLEGQNTRPTSERAKEAIFSMLQFEIQGKQVLDLFAGSGQMGLEALSRGASSALLCDRSKEAIEVIRSNALKTRLAPMCEIICSDYATLLKSFRRKKKFDLIFLDPPYAISAIPETLRMLLEYELLGKEATVVCETGSVDDVFGVSNELNDRFEVLRQAKYGVAFVTVLRLKEQTGGTES